MKKRSGLTAEELMQKLEADPDYVARRMTKDAQIVELASECENDEAQLVSELRSVGLNVCSVWDLVNNTHHPVLEREFTGNYEFAYPILVNHLSVEHHPRIREGIIRALSEPQAREIATASLLRQFQEEENKSLRWVIANALQTILPKSELSKFPEIELVLSAGYL